MCWWYLTSTLIILQWTTLLYFQSYFLPSFLFPPLDAWGSFPSASQRETPVHYQSPGQAGICFSAQSPQFSILTTWNLPARGFETSIFENQSIHHISCFSFWTLNSFSTVWIKKTNKKPIQFEVFLSSLLVSQGIAEKDAYLSGYLSFFRGENTRNEALILASKSTPCSMPQNTSVSFHDIRWQHRIPNSSKPDLSHSSHFSISSKPFIFELLFNDWHCNYVSIRLLC